MKTILLPTDFSENAWNAMRYAAALFGSEPCRYILINTYQMPPATVDGHAMNYIGALDESAREGLEATLNKFKQLDLHPESYFETKALMGSVASQTNTLAEDFDAEYIVMGTKGASGLKQVLMGSNTASVVKSAKCSVLCIPEDSHFLEPKKVFFTTDLKEITDLNALSPVKELAKKYDSRLVLLNIHVVSPRTPKNRVSPEELNLHEYFADVPHEFVNWEALNIEEGIQEYAQIDHPEMIVMLKRNHSFWERLFNRSQTKQMAFHTDTPLLVIHE